MELNVQAPCFAAMEAAKRHWDAVAKPLGSLGAFEDIVVKIAGIRDMEAVRCEKKAVLVYCGDHGVTREGVSQSRSDVTALVAESIALGRSNVNRMAAAAHADVFCVDMGMEKDVQAPGILKYRQGAGTANFTKGPAMTRAQAESAVLAGIDTVRLMKERGYDLLAVGEMGIGNTTACAALVSALLGIAPKEAAGRGAGLSDEGLQNKIRAVETALAVNRPDLTDPWDVLSKLGGFEIAGMTGAFLGGMIYRLPVVIDGVISSAAASIAQRICPEATSFMLASHLSREHTGAVLLEKLGLEPVLRARMGLGEGTGAVMLFPLIDMELGVYNSAHTFSSLGMEAYTPLGGKQ